MSDTETTEPIVTQNSLQRARVRLDELQTRQGQILAEEARYQAEADAIERRLADITVESPPAAFAAVAGERERLKLLKVRLLELFRERQALDPELERAESRVGDLELPLLLGRRIVADLQTNGLRNRQLHGLTVGELLAKVEAARRHLAWDGVDVGEIIVKL